MSPVIAPSITIGAVILSWRRAATKVIVSHDPSGTVPITLTPFGARPLSRTRFVLTAVSSINTSRAGSRKPCSRIQRRRARATSARCRSAACRLFLRLMLWRSRKRQSELRLVRMRRLRSSASVSSRVRSGCLVIIATAPAPGGQSRQISFVNYFMRFASAEPALLVVKRGHTREPHVRVAQLAEMPHARHQRQPCAWADVLLQVSSDLLRRHRVGVAPADVHWLFHEGERRQPARLFEALAVVEV